MTINMKMCDHDGMCTCGEYSFGDPFAPEPVEDPDKFIHQLNRMKDYVVWVAEKYQQKLADFDAKPPHMSKAKLAKMREMHVDNINKSVAGLTYVAHQCGLIVPKFW
jgi:hypothetical protein